MDKMNDQELISALADGQLRGAAFARGVEAAADPAGRRTWQAYHLIGEVLRNGQAAAAHDGEAFLARLQLRLREEREAAPAALIATREVLVAVQAGAQDALQGTESARGLPIVDYAPAAGREPAANDWRWKVAAGVASMAAVVAIGWNVAGGGAASGAPQLASAPSAVVPVRADTTPMLRDPRLDRLLAAHRQLGGATALQSTSGFLRNATFEGPAR